MSGNHTHGTGSSERALRWALALTGSFLVAEVVAGILTGSLALISDAAHMLTDTIAIAIALAAIRIGKRPPDARRTFGYQRFEILAAAFNALLLFAVAGYILFEAWQRLRNPVPVASLGMLVVATLGLLVNLVSMRLLAGGKDASLNVKGAYLEVWSDMLGSIGVIAAAVVIRFTGWTWVDTVVAVAIGLWVLPRTWILLRDTVNILLEGVPDGIDPDAVAAAMTSVPGVASVHHLHIWAITSGSVSLTAHVVVAPGASAEDEVLPALRAVVDDRFAIVHTTLQIETRPCRDYVHETPDAATEP
jgi:cobalt-zinc-cadmium efflux system protein